LQHQVDVDTDRLRLIVIAVLLLGGLMLAVSS
jgi:hypothetical protein